MTTPERPATSCGLLPSAWAIHRDAEDPSLGSDCVSRNESHCPSGEKEGSCGTSPARAGSLCSAPSAPSRTQSVPCDTKASLPWWENAAGFTVGVTAPRPRDADAEAGAEGVDCGVAAEGHGTLVGMDTLEVATPEE